MRVRVRVKEEKRKRGKEEKRKRENADPRRLPCAIIVMISRHAGARNTAPSNPHAWQRSLASRTIRCLLVMTEERIAALESRLDVAERALTAAGDTTQTQCLPIDRLLQA